MNAMASVPDYDTASPVAALNSCIATLRRITETFMESKTVIPPGVVAPEFLTLADAPTLIGHDNLFGYYARHHPEAIGFMSDPVNAISEEVEEVRQFCLKSGASLRKGKAPTALVERGVQSVDIFPVDLLEDFYR